MWSLNHTRKISKIVNFILCIKKKYVETPRHFHSAGTYGEPRMCQALYEAQEIRDSSYLERPTCISHTDMNPYRQKRRLVKTCRHVHLIHLITIYGVPSMCQAIGWMMGLQWGTNRHKYCPHGLRTQTRNHLLRHTQTEVHKHTHNRHIPKQEAAKVYQPHTSWVRYISSDAHKGKHDPISSPCTHPSCNQWEFH